MKLHSLRISNFQSFGPAPTPISFEPITYLIGPNGAGKTATLQALCRLFAFDPTLRRVKRSDFHVPGDEAEVPELRSLWIEADFHFPELEGNTESYSVPPHFSHMRLDTADGVPRVRYRLNATMDVDGFIEENLIYVHDLDSDGEPLSTSTVGRHERSSIQLHYLPARRDPADHITYGANALLGRILRAVDWAGDRDAVKDLTNQINDQLCKNKSIRSFSDALTGTWKKLHKGQFFADPKITFATTEVESLLRHMSISFTPGHEDAQVDFSRLSDGQKSMLYLSLVLSIHAIGRDVMVNEDATFDPIKLKPPAFTLIAVEEPENSLSPHYLGRIVTALNSSVGVDAQALIATHAPSMLRRVKPDNIRYLRLNEQRHTKVTCIVLPPESEGEALKFVREAVQAFPEIYFSRLVVLGEGDSEEIVLPRILQAKGAPVDESAVTIAPLGGRHVNHFWRLLSALETPYLTLLDLDVARYGGGWGRIGTVNKYLTEFEPALALPRTWKIPKWNDKTRLIRDDHKFDGQGIFELLQAKKVFFSQPMDLDFAMLTAYPTAYDFVGAAPDAATFKAVLGKKPYKKEQYTDQEQQLFATYHQRFKLKSKPAAHINALANLTDEQLLANLPLSLDQLADAVIEALKDIPE